LFSHPILKTKRREEERRRRPNGGRQSKRIVRGRDNRNGWRGLCSRRSEERSVPGVLAGAAMNLEQTSAGESEATTD